MIREALTIVPRWRPRSGTDPVLRDDPEAVAGEMR